MSDGRKRPVADRAAIDMFLLSNLHPTQTGVAGAVVWVSCGEFAAAASKLGPRILVVLGERIMAEGRKDAVPVRLAEPPEVVGTLPGETERQVVMFVDMNRETLLRYWDGQLSTREMVDLLRRA